MAKFTAVLTRVKDGCPGLTVRKFDSEEDLYCGVEDLCIDAHREHLDGWEYKGGFTTSQCPETRFGNSDIHSVITMPDIKDATCFITILNEG